MSGSHLKPSQQLLNIGVPVLGQRLKVTQPDQRRVFSYPLGARHHLAREKW